MKNIFLFLLQGIPETTGFIALSLAFAKIEIKWRQIALLGTLFSVVIYIIRLLPIAFGLHSLMAPLLTVIFLTRYTKTPPSRALVISFLSLAILATLEMLVSETVLFFTKLNSNQLLSNTMLWVSLGVIQAFILNIIAIVVSKVKKPTEDTLGI